MKKQFFLPVLVAVFAVGSAFASIEMDPGYYGPNDSDCNGEVSVEPQCPIGFDADCDDGLGNLFYTKSDRDAPTHPQNNPCTILQKRLQ